ncbi:hypothetical protein BSLA_03f0384 [Burkholderia stabilis]|nr:hypothetical protein BSLA_03f0384 [Burkholderia stabilis]
MQKPCALHGSTAFCSKFGIDVSAGGQLARGVFSSLTGWEKG